MMVISGSTEFNLTRSRWIRWTSGAVYDLFTTGGEAGRAKGLLLADFCMWAEPQIRWRDGWRYGHTESKTRADFRREFLSGRE